MTLLLPVLPAQHPGRAAEHELAHRLYARHLFLTEAGCCLSSVHRKGLCKRPGAMQKSQQGQVASFLARRIKGKLESEERPVAESIKYCFYCMHSPPS